MDPEGTVSEMYTRRRRTTAVIATLALTGALLAGCALGSDEATDGSMQLMTPSAAPDAVEEYAGDGVASAPAFEDRASDVANVAESERMVIRTKTMRLQVDSTADAVESVRTLVSKHEGVITDLQVATDSDEWLYRYDEQGYATGDGAALRGWVTVRVPVDRFATFSDEVMALGTVNYQSEASEDVTQQHVDMAARLENLRAQEARLREFFDAAKTVDDMIKIEQELGRVRGEIESLDAQVKYLERQAAMATVTIELTEEKPVVRPDGDSWGFRDAITNGVRGAAEVLTFGIALIIATAPLWIIALVAFFIIRAVVRKRRNRTQSGPATPAVGASDSEADSPAPIVGTDAPAPRSPDVTPSAGTDEG